MMPLECVMQGAYCSIKDALTVAEFKWARHECTNAHAAHFSNSLAAAPACARPACHLAILLEARCAGLQRRLPEDSGHGRPTAHADQLRHRQHFISEVRFGMLI